MPSPCARITKLPPEMVTVPALAVSPSSGTALIPSPCDVTLKLPPVMVTEPSEAMPLFAAVATMVPPWIASAASAPPLMAFLALPFAVSVPVPKIVRLAPLLTFTAAPS